MKMINKSKEGGITEGSLWNKILLFALPLAATSVLQQLFNSADIAVVGRFCGSEALAAVGSNQAIINLIINLFVGLSIGANVVVSRYIGQGRKEKIGSAVHTAIAIAILSGVFLLVVGFFITKPILILIGSPKDVINLASAYLKIYFIGMPFMMIYNFGSAILRSKGDTKKPLICLCISGVVNVILNLFFVLVCKLGVAGVGIATVIANIISSSCILYFLTHEENEIKLDLKNIKINKHNLKSMARIGLPAGLQGMVFSISNVCIQAAINSFGSDGIAGSSAALNYEYFTYFLLNAFSQTAVTFVSQNYGARKYSRCKKALLLCIIFGSTSCFILSMIFYRWKHAFISIYTTKDAVYKYAFIRMRYVLIFQFINSFLDIISGGLRGLGRSLVPALITIAGVCGFRLLWVGTVFVKNHTYKTLMMVYPVSWIITVAVIVIAYFVLTRKIYNVDTEEVI
ncbi:MATE family efflux transporter [Clostridium sp. MSJ-8]|uniref:MATE family efflux transporter n=1 Tax=Clostridium sp. MSJ-8 TaxID=2841510 RepID=UPI00209ED293|nr:MATE family efflux transporter [Clostridium sp. MSJ-8]